MLRISDSLMEDGEGWEF